MADVAGQRYMKVMTIMTVIFKIMTVIFKIINLFSECRVKRCPIMEKRKLFYEKHLTFPECIPAVGQNNRQEWGSFNHKRRQKIRQLKKNNPFWQTVVTDQIKLALQCRKIRLFQRDLQDINLIYTLRMKLHG